LHNLLKHLSLILALFLTGNLSAQKILVRPYLQPGNASSLSNEQKVLIWQTDSIPSNFNATYNLVGSSDKILGAKISNVELNLKSKRTYLYRAVLENLQFDTAYVYEVRMNEKIIAHDTFRTRTKKPFTQFAVLGDFGAGTSQQAAIAFRIAQQEPQFVLTTGDNVYQNGLEEEYRKNLFPYYLSQQNDPTKGTLLMNTIPFYMVLGNHDVRSDSLDKQPGSFAYFYYNDLPMNAPKTERTATLRGSANLVKAFKKNTKPRFPAMSNFSFDYGNVHITCLDANDYVNPLDPLLITWLKRDIGKSNADWKIVTFHHPGFNSSIAHYDYQLMRLLSPLFEKLGVNLVLTGHVHNYQRSVPLLFDPKKNEAGDQYIISPEGKVDGTFTLDTNFDGDKYTKPKGIIYIVTGAGGGGLYDRNLNDKPELWKHEPKENWEPFTQKLIADRHSFTWIETREKELLLQQIDLTGKVIDQIKITR
jgi:predicted MPP superfamily phosphohydrolase